MACSCSKVSIPCSEFCGCADKCQNKWNTGNKETDVDSDSDGSSAEEEDD